MQEVWNSKGQQVLSSLSLPASTCVCTAVPELGRAALSISGAAKEQCWALPEAEASLLEQQPPEPWFIRNQQAISQEEMTNVCTTPPLFTAGRCSILWSARSCACPTTWEIIQWQQLLLGRNFDKSQYYRNIWRKNSAFPCKSGAETHSGNNQAA